MNLIITSGEMQIKYMKEMEIGTGLIWIRIHKTNTLHLQEKAFHFLILACHTTRKILKTSSELHTFCI